MPEQTAWEARVSRSRAHRRSARLQPLARAAGRALHPFVHRHVLWPQRVLVAADARARNREGRHLPRSFARGATSSRTSCDWQFTNLVIIFTIGIVLLGLSAAAFGGWVERVGPRKTGFVAALCWSGGFVISALGVYVHQLWILWLGLGLIGGVGLGLGYISPVSTLVKWFPDRRGMATGMAIMGFGGGAMIGSPLANLLMNSLQDADFRRRLANLRGAGGDLFRLHDGRAPSSIGFRRRTGGPKAGRLPPPPRP